MQIQQLFYTHEPFVSIFGAMGRKVLHELGRRYIGYLGKEAVMSLKILFTASSLSHIKNFHIPYIEEFRRMGWTVHVACGGSSDAFLEADCFFQLPFKKRLTSVSNFKAMKIIRAAIEKNRYNLICTHTSLAAFFTRMAAGGEISHSPVVDVVHGYLFREKPVGFRDNLLLLAEKLAARKTNLLLTMNSEDFRVATKNRLCERIVQIPGMGVNFLPQEKVIASEVQCLRKVLLRAEDEIMLLCAAEFSPRKNQEMLIRALEKLPERVCLIMPGEGVLLDYCRKLADKLGVADRIVFPGQVNNMPLWYAAADIAVSSSRSEGLPFSIIEAMYAGLPVVVSEIKGHTDLIDNEQNGLLYSCDDVTGFTGQIIRLINNPDLAGRLGKAAKNTAADYSLEKVLPKVTELYLSAAVMNKENNDCETNS